MRTQFPAPALPRSIRRVSVSGIAAAIVNRNDAYARSRQLIPKTLMRSPCGLNCRWYIHADSSSLAMVKPAVIRRRRAAKGASRLNARFVSPAESSGANSSLRPRRAGPLESRFRVVGVSPALVAAPLDSASPKGRPSPAARGGSRSVGLVVCIGHCNQLRARQPSGSKSVTR